jgi:tetratricopeptide (TPR) repeat protein
MRGGIDSTRQFVETGNIQELELAILFWQEGARISSVIDAVQAHRIISYIAYDKFITTRDREIGTTLIELLRRLLENDEEDQKTSHQRTLGKLLHEYYLSFGDPTAAEESIAINRRLLDVTPSGPDQVEILNFLGTSLMNRGKVTGNTTDLWEAVKLLSGVLEEDEEEEGQDLDDDRTTTMNILATAKRTLAELTGERDLAHEAVELYRQVITRLPPGDSSYGSTLALLAMSIQFNLYNSPEPEQTALDEVVQLHKMALELMPLADIYRPMCLYALAKHYIILGKRNIPKISSVYPLAVDYMSQALALMQPEDPQRILILHSLAEAQIHLSETTGNYQALMETPAVRVFEELQDTRRAGIFDHIHVEHTRAARLIRKAHLTGDRVPLEDGIRLLRETLVQQPNDIGLLLNLASALHLTHQVSHDQRALEESMLLYRQLNPLILADHPARATFLQNFAATLEACRRMFGLNARLISAEIVSLLEQALDILPGQQPERVNILTNLGHVSLQQFKDFEDPRYLDDSANYHRAALLMRSHTHMDRALNLHDLASIAEHRAQLTGDDAYVREAVSLYEETLDFEPPGHPSRSSEMYALSCIYANSTYSIFDLHMAVFFLEQALADDATAPLTRVLEGILSLKTIESQYSDEQDQNRPLQRRLFACYQHLVQSLPRAVCFSFDVERRSEMVTLFDATWLGHHAALHAADLAALGFEDPLLAPELLEQCRSIFWLQALNLRTRDFDGVPPHQADELRSLLQVLDSNSHDSSPFSAQHVDIMEAENAVAARRRQADRASQLIREIRKHSGLERFLMGRTMSEMIHGTKGSVTVLLVGTPAFSQVWILGQSEMIPVRTLRLQITDQTLKELAAAAYKIDPSRLRGSTGDDESDSEHDEPHVRLSMNTRPVKDSRMKRLLSETWLKVVKPIFDAMGLKVSQFEVLLVPPYSLIYHF